MAFQNTTLGLSLSLLFAMAIVPYAHAQEAQQQTGRAAATQAAAPDYSEETLKTFVLAKAEVEKIAGDYQAKMSRAEDPETAQQLQQEATNEMVNAVKEVGIEVQEYNEIANQVVTNPQLAQKIQQLDAE